MLNLAKLLHIRNHLQQLLFSKILCILIRVANEISLDREGQIRAGCKMKKWTVQDRYGNDIYLTEERWQHILESRPETVKS